VVVGTTTSEPASVRSYVSISCQSNVSHTS
jgi:hypothetical protein